MSKILEITTEIFQESLIIQRKDHYVYLAKIPSQENKYVGSDHTYGFKPKDKDPWGAGKILIYQLKITIFKAQCITGESVYGQVKADDALGRATRHGYKNQTKTGDESRVFGVPTIRNDINKPGLKSVADSNVSLKYSCLLNFMQNYGDEPDAVGLLFPQRFSEMGVGNNDFDVLRPKEQVRIHLNVVLDTVYNRSERCLPILDMHINQESSKVCL